MAGIINHDARSEIRAIQQQSVAVGDSQSAMWASYIGQRLDDLRALLLADTHEWPPDETRPMTREERHVFQREISRQSRKRCTTHHHACDCRERAFRELIEEVLLWHSDPELPEYNECDKYPCMWCENARLLLPETLTEGKP